MLMGMPSVVSEAFAFLLIAEKGGHIMYCPCCLLISPAKQSGSEAPSLGHVLFLLAGMCMHVYVHVWHHWQPL